VRSNERGAISGDFVGNPAAAGHSGEGAAAPEGAINGWALTIRLQAYPDTNLPYTNLLALLAEHGYPNMSFTLPSRARTSG
jgi:hypothetical protein